MWLHDWLILRDMGNGLEEYCSRCGKTEFFRDNIPNDEYLSSHLRLTLSPNNFPETYYEEYRK